MNKTHLLGRLTRDPDIRMATNGETKICRFTLAVNRSFKNAEGQYQADFISCLILGKRADFVEQYLHKGSRCIVTGSLQTGSYVNKEGITIYTTEVFVSEIESVEPLPKSKPEDSSMEEWVPMHDGLPEDDENPFPFH